MTVWTVTCRAVRASDSDVKFASIRCAGIDKPITNPADAVAFTITHRLDHIRRALPGYELSEWTATPFTGTTHDVPVNLA